MGAYEDNQIRDRKFAKPCCKVHCEIIHPPQGNKGWKCSKCGRKFTFHPKTLAHACDEFNTAWRDLVFQFAKEGRKILQKIPIIRHRVKRGEHER